MRPDFACVDQVDGVSGNAVLSRQLVQRLFPFERPQFSDLLIGELRSSVALAAMLHFQALVVGVLKVLAGRHPLQVLGTVIRLDAVFVVRLLAFFRRANECCADKPVDFRGAATAVFQHERYAQVALSIWRRAQHVAMWLTANAASVADLIGIRVLNGQPAFHTSCYRDLNVDARVLAVRVEYGVSSLSA